MHSHHQPPFFFDEMLADTPVRKWSVSQHLENMDRAGIQTAMLSIPPGSVRINAETVRLGDIPWFHDIKLAQRIPRQSNEYAARMALDHPGRFGVFAATPLPYIAEALKEIEYGLDVLKCRGVGLYTSYSDKWLGDPAFAPVFEELNRRKALVFVHPVTANCCANLIPEVPEPVIELGTDTTRAIAQFVFNGSSQRYPNVRMIFSHAGGTMPFLVERFELPAKNSTYRDLLPNGFQAETRRFYFDTAQACNSTAMQALKSLVPASHILFGTDQPARDPAEENLTLRASGVFTISELQAIQRDNFLKLST